MRASRGVDGGHGPRAQNWADHMKANRKRSRKRPERARHVQISCLFAQPEKNLEKIFCLLTRLCLDIRKEGRIPSLDLVLLSRDFTMGKIYPPNPPVSVDLTCERISVHDKTSCQRSGHHMLSRNTKIGTHGERRARRRCPHPTPARLCERRHMVGIDIDSAVSPPAGFQLEVTVFHWV